MGQGSGGAPSTRRLRARLSLPLIVLDTGVVISALVGSKDASSFRICRAIGTGRLRLAISDRFLTELTDTVRRKTTDGQITDPARTFDVALDIGFHGEHFVFEPLPWKLRDPKDHWIPDLAYRSLADFIVTNDPHLLEANLPIPVEVVTSAQMRERLGI